MMSPSVIALLLLLVMVIVTSASPTKRHSHRGSLMHLKKSRLWEEMPDELKESLSTAATGSLPRRQALEAWQTYKVVGGASERVSS